MKIHQDTIFTCCVSKDQLVYKDTGLEVEWQTTIFLDPTYGWWDVVWPNFYGRKSWNILMQASVHVLWCSTFDDPGIYLNINSYLCKTTMYKVICCSLIWKQLRTRKPRTCLTKALIKQLTVHQCTGIPCSHRKKHKDILYKLLQTDHFWDTLGREKARKQGKRTSQWAKVCKSGRGSLWHTWFVRA